MRHQEVERKRRAIGNVERMQRANEASKRNVKSCLQSESHDPGVGRFFNADDLAFLGASGTVLGYNLYGYCENNAVNMVDCNGYIAVADDMLIWGLCIAVCLVLAIVISVYISSDEYQRAFRNLISSVRSDLRWKWNSFTIWFQSTTKVLTRAIETSIAKAREVIKHKKNQEYYWIASKVTYNRKGVRMTTYFPCMPISKSAAAAYVKAGGDVFASSKIAAKKLAASINGGPPEGPEISGKGGLGYFYHYHARKRIGAGSGGGHIFFLN